MYVVSIHFTEQFKHQTSYVRMGLISPKHKYHMKKVLSPLSPTGISSVFVVMSVNTRLLCWQECYVHTYIRTTP